jgi:RHS repeat-associated protein
LQAVGSNGRSYDASGNSTAITNASGALNFSYDPTGRMSQVANASNTVLMQYGTNALGERVEKYLTGNSADTDLVEYDEAGHVIGDYNGTGTGARIDELIWMDGMPVAILSGTAGTLSYIESDQLGTPRVAIDGTSNTATWTWSPVNDPFGETQPVGTLALNLRMPGQSYDAESGLNYNGFRDFDPSSGRYVESDPTGLNGGISTFGYVGGNPLSSSDEFGLSTVDARIGVLGIEAAADSEEAVTELETLEEAANPSQLDRIRRILGAINTAAKLLHQCPGMNASAHSEDDAENEADSEDTPQDAGDNSGIPQAAKDKIPPEWGDGQPNRKGDGTRWQDPDDQGNGVRIDEGDPDNSQPSQQVDHVIVRNGGQVIGRDGQPIGGSIKQDPTNAHIPLSEWLKWSKWNKP